MAADGGTIDFRKLKALVARSFPQGHPVRETVLQEPDDVPMALALGKADSILRLLQANP